MPKRENKMLFKAFLVAITLQVVSSEVSADPSWMTLVLTNFEIDKACAQDWTSSHSCINPDVRVMVSVPSSRFSSAAWPISSQLFMKDATRHFTSQWTADLSNVEVSVAIEGEGPPSATNGPVICDKAVKSVQFSTKIDETSSEKSVLKLKSGCFRSTVLVVKDLTCPVCSIKQKSPKINIGTVEYLRQSVAGYDLLFIGLSCTLILLLVVLIIMTACDSRYPRTSATECSPRSEKMRLNCTKRGSIGGGEMQRSTSALLKAVSRPNSWTESENTDDGTMSTISSEQLYDFSLGLDRSRHYRKNSVAVEVPPRYQPISFYRNITPYFKNNKKDLTIVSVDSAFCTV
ncbi:unnamed protein product [Caenorhabditis auriculariae]|uniref:C2 domain-containing protein n=1 Tax=Caenorhabditis auriculariae TaxID=2777116 RepID=A0A8S1HAX4_9PELO|nr:unnamed protein product [Caenorhabditis auriculariae]